MGRHLGIGSSQRLELAGRGLERHARQAGDLGRNLHGELGVGIEARAHGRTALGQLLQVRQHVFQVLQAMLQLGDVTRELLPQRERRGVLQVGTADLDDVLEGLGLGLEGVAQLLQRRDEVLVDGHGRSHVHGRGEHVVGGLTPVHVVIGMDLARFAALAAHQLAAAVGQNLVEVHVGLGPRTGLPDGQREFTIMLAGQHLVGGRLDGLGLVGCQLPQSGVDRGGRTLDGSQRPDQLRRLLLGGNPEVLQRTLSLRAPQAIGRDGDLAKGVALHAHGSGHGNLLGLLEVTVTIACYGPPLPR